MVPLMYYFSYHKEVAILTKLLNTSEYFSYTIEPSSYFSCRNSYVCTSVVCLDVGFILSVTILCWHVQKYATISTTF
jgi:hypothetical protein